MSRDETALGIRRLINLRMSDGIRLMTLRRGVDPRKFALLSFGGAAGLHAVEVARDLEIPRVIVPTVASVLSAWGMLASDLRYEVSQTHVGEGAAMNDARLRELFADLEARATARLGEWFRGPARIERSAEMRYGEQVFEVDVALDDLAWDAPDLVSRVHERFHARHEELFTYASRDQEVVFVNARAAAIGATPAPNEDMVATEPTAEPRIGERRAYFDGWRTVPVYRIEALRPGMTVEGPAIFDAETTTVLAAEGDAVTVNRYSWLDIRLRR
jgi:N-methylhydantoinase A